MGPELPHSLQRITSATNMDETFALVMGYTCKNYICKNRTCVLVVFSFKEETGFETLTKMKMSCSKVVCAPIQ